ncbi:zinc finger protein 180 isoform X5 [Sciurus carolinensis]|uniref:zinc finger protein 180 isoform X5 n=1 Tax=Sciurus carolinensis TaxID=30640 RepID=UPI001FB1FD96|nr:zinc finger protein 180 isoform X5 [Sciurus carolinensis]
MCTDSGEIQRRPVPPMLYLFSGGLDSVQVDEVLNCRFCFLREGLCHCPCTLEQVLSRKQVQFSTLPCLEHSMEGQDEKPPGPLKACTQDSLLPQEIIIKVEGEDAGSLTIPSQPCLPRENCIEEEGKKIIKINHWTFDIRASRAIDPQGCGCGLQQGGAGAAGPCPEEAIPRGDAGELQEPGVCG